jgi:hypothetical protein
VLPLTSVAVNVLVVVVTGNGSPDAIPLVRPTVAIAQLSVPVAALYDTTAEHCPASLSTVSSAGHVIVGASLSLTVTVNEHVARLVQQCYFVVRMLTRIPVCPALSVIVHATDVGVPLTLNVDPLGGLHDVEEPGLESELVGENDTTALHELASLDCVMSGGHVIDGG